MSETTPVVYLKKPLPPRFIQFGWAATSIGLILVLAAYAVDHTRASYNNIIGLTLLAGISVGALLLVALEYLAGAVWSTPFRRVMEFVAAATPLVILFALPLFFDLHNLYHWTNAAIVQSDTILRNKTPYLNVNFFMIRFAVFVGLWLLFNFFLSKNSKKQDATKDQKLTTANIRWSTLFVPVFALSMTFFGIDWVMSLEAHWFSTIFGVYFFIGSVLTALAVATFLIVTLNESGYFVAGLGKDHYYSLGALIFAFTNFWAYIAFSQFMLTWYANVPEETFWFIARWHNGWQYASVLLIIVKFAVPYGVLLSQPSKKDPAKLKFIGAWMVGAQFFDLYWLVMPSYSKSFVFGWMELGFPLLVVGLIALVFAAKYNNNNLVPIGDPKLQRGINFHL